MSSSLFGYVVWLVILHFSLVERFPNSYLNVRNARRHVQEDGLEQFDPGTLEGKVPLADRDSEYDDVYDLDGDDRIQSGLKTADWLSLGTFPVGGFGYGQDGMRFCGPCQKTLASTNI